MATYKGTCTGTYASGFTFQITATQKSQSTSGNYSNVTVSVVLKANSSAYSAYNSVASDNWVTVTVAGKTVANKVNMAMSITTTGQTLYSDTVKVYHNDDGTKKAKITASFSMNNSILSSGSASGTLSLTTIARVSPIAFDGADTIDAGAGSLAVTISPYSSAFSHSALWTFGSESVTQDLPTGTNATSLNIPKDWLLQFPAAESMTGTVKVTTLNGTSSIGSKSLTFTVTCPVDVVPVITSATWSADNSSSQIGSIAANTGMAIANVSVITVSATLQEDPYVAPASIKAEGLGIGSINVEGSLSVELGKPITSGDIKVTITDLRGRMAETTISGISVASYIPPTLRSAAIARCLSDKTESATADAKFGVVAYAADFSTTVPTVENPVTLTITRADNAAIIYKQVEITNKTDSVLFGEKEGGTEGVFEVDSAYDIRVTLSDAMGGTSSLVGTIPSVEFMFHFGNGGKSITIGGTCDVGQEGLKIEWPTKGEGFAQAVLALLGDYIVEHGSNDIWTWDKYASGRIRFEGATDITASPNTANGNGFHSEAVLIDLPFATATDVEGIFDIASAGAWATQYNTYADKIGFRVGSVRSRTDYSYRVKIFAWATWK